MIEDQFLTLVAVSWQDRGMSPLDQRLLLGRRATITWSLPLRNIGSLNVRQEVLVDPDDPDTPTQPLPPGWKWHQYGTKPPWPLSIGLWLKNQITSALWRYYYDPGWMPIQDGSAMKSFSVGGVLNE